MCGFIGVVSKKDINHNQLKLSNEIQTCRGPDEIKFLKKNLTPRIKMSNLGLHLFLIGYLFKT